MTWGYHNGLLKHYEIQIISDSIAKIRKLGYNGFNYEGKYKLVTFSNKKATLISNSFVNPKVEYIFGCEDGISEDQYALIKEVLNYGRDTNARQVLVGSYEIEGLYVYSCEDYEYDAWEERRREGADGGTGSERSGGGETQNAVETVVDSYSNEVISMGVLYSINAKKEPAVLNAPQATVNLLPDTDSKIKVSKLLDFVNK